MEDRGQFLVGLAVVDLIIPVVMSAGLAFVPPAIPFMPVFWLCVLLILFLNGLLAVAQPTFRVVVGFVVGLNLISTYVLGALAFLPKLHVWIYIMIVGFRNAPL